MKKYIATLTGKNQVNPEGEEKWEPFALHEIFEAESNEEAVKIAKRFLHGAIQTVESVCEIGAPIPLEGDIEPNKTCSRCKGQMQETPDGIRCPTCTAAAIAAIPSFFNSK
jgi:hypothetical protein